MNIQFDDKNLFASAVGEEHGLDPDAIKEGAQAGLEGLAAFQRASEAGTYGFPHLPFQNATVKSILRYEADVRGTYDTVCVIGIGGSALGAWALD